MNRALIIDEDPVHLGRVGAGLRTRGLVPIPCVTRTKAIRMLEGDGEGIELVILRLWPNPDEAVQLLRQLYARDLKVAQVARQILCVSENLLDASVVLEIESYGARVVYEG